MQRRTLLTALFSVSLLGFSHFASALTANKDYAELQPAQPGSPAGQIEVLEFFSYGCPHCASFEPKLTRWRAAQGKDVVFKRVPVSFGRKEWATLARIHLTLSAMGLADKLDQAVFDAVHKKYIKLEDEKNRNDFLTQNEVDVKKFNDTWNSFGINSQAQRAEQMVENYRVQSVPMLVIEGRYSPRHEEKLPPDQGNDKVLENASALVAKVRSEKTGKKK